MGVAADRRDALLDFLLEAVAVEGRRRFPNMSWLACGKWSGVMRSPITSGPPKSRWSSRSLPMTRR